MNAARVFIFAINSLFFYPEYPHVAPGESIIAIGGTAQITTRYTINQIQ